MWRRWVSLVAVFGMLLHGAAVARHIVIIAGTPQPLDRNVVFAGQLDADLGSICHSGLTGGSPEHDNQRPADPARHCPVCTGLVSAALLEPPSGIVVPASIAIGVGARTFRHADQCVTVLRRIRPESRGPPIGA